MKKWIASVLVLLLVHNTQVYAQLNVKSRTYQTGVYLFCGNQLPKKFEYIIQRKADNESEFTTIALTKIPSSIDACNGRVMSLPTAIAAQTKVEDAVIKKVWAQCNRNETLDSLYAYALDPRYQYVAGCSWFDETVIPNTTYTYRIGRKLRNDSIEQLQEQRISYPEKSYDGRVKVVRFKPEEKSIIIQYAVSDSLYTAGVKLWRSKHLENNFTEVSAALSFIKVNNQTVAQIVDATAAKGVTYSYVARAYDALGNMGTPSDTLNIYNLNKAADIGMVKNFYATAKEDGKGIELKWKLKSDAGLTSIDIYRSKEYDGKFNKIASVQPKEAQYVDVDKGILPATTYYYYIVANASYGMSFPSTRTPVILKGNADNLLPPQNLNIIRKGNVVTLTFRNTETDTRAFYVYRGNGFTGQLKQLPRMLLSTENELSYNDTLPYSPVSQTFSYAVADVNTSYNISPLSDRVSVQISGNIPVVSNVNVQLVSNGILVSWKDMVKLNAAISNYKLYRTVVNTSGEEVEKQQLLAALNSESNSYTDTALIKGMHYRYQVQAIGLGNSDEGSLSQAASITYGTNNLLQPTSIVALISNKKAVLKWINPADEAITKIRIYRSSPGKAITLIKELSINTKEFEDTNVTEGNVYYYYLASANSQSESTLSDPVTVRVK
jgi:hypothetical protein